MTKSLIVGLALVGMLAAVEADAALVICQKGSKIKLRVDACKTKETLVPATDLGVVGPEGVQGPQGDPGTPGSARAFAQVTPDGPALTAGRSLNFSAVTRAATGVYCLTPTPGSGVDPATGTAVVGVEWGASSGFDLLASLMLSSVGFSCPATDYEVRTYKLPAGVATASDQVGFTIIVP